MTETTETESGGAEQNETIVDPENFDETIRMECPECGLSGDVPDEWKGLQIECKECDERFTVRPTEPGTDQIAEK
ncbi:hypothetical protein [Natronoarchaeum rubrum]|uniref:hypothetical protein n=1 Tax=Natronoarchaeum rubrum TaxID=755311 RepID=UPI0021114741|nr:hypothetical protein [Natronoarchaeum rubrum]